MIKIQARAKINLFLEVTARRPDGYHDLATLFAKVGIYDDLELRRGRPGIRLSVSGGDIPGSAAAADNIIYKAAVKFFAAFGLAPAVEIKLRKNLPVGAGLGGGSSDAAAALLGLCRLYRIKPASVMKKLMKLAAGLGSDVPFFLLEEGMALGAGRGEKLKAVKPAGKMPEILLVYPGVPVYTKEVYGALRLGKPAEIKARRADLRRLLRLLKTGKFDGGKAGLMFNRLEAPVLPRHREVRRARAELAEAGADAVLMSGSGATVFALVWDRPKARRIARVMASNQKYRVFLAKFC